MSQSSDRKWRPLYGHEGVAQISRSGIIETIDREYVDARGHRRRHRRHRLRMSGKRSLSICIGRRRIHVARAVYESWVRPLRLGERLAYRDGNCRNVMLSNLIVAKRGESKRLITRKDRYARADQSPVQLQAEVWREIPGHAGRYQLSNMSRVKSVAQIPAIILTTRMSPLGSVTVSLHGPNRQCRSIATLMRAIWPELRDEYRRVKHKSGNVSGIETAKKTARKRGQKQPGDAVKTRQKSNVSDEKTG